MKVLFRCDASSRIGTGHLVRSLALAQALHDGGDQGLLLTSDPTGPFVDDWRRDGSEVHRVDAAVGSEADAGATARLATQAGVDWVVLDGYTFDAGYRRRLAAQRLVVVDDLGERDLDADLVVNGHFHGSPAMYPGAKGRLLVGPRYALLRRSLRSFRAATDRSGVVLTLGGADPDARTGPVLEALSAAGIRGRVVIGPRHPSPETVRRTAKASGWEVAGSPTTMAPLLATASVAVVGAGTTTLECAYLGTPMVAVLIAANQRPVIDALLSAGIAATADARDAGAVAAAAASLLADAETRRRMSGAARRLVDGRGAIRVAAAMRAALLVLRPAEADDTDILLAWRNDPSTRHGSFIPDPIRHDEHVAWLTAVLADPDRILLVGELAGAPVGVVRLDRRGDHAEISVTIAPAARGRGLAPALISAGLQHAFDARIGRVDAFIRPENDASRRAFRTAGFREVDREPHDAAPPSALRMTITPQRP